MLIGSGEAGKLVADALFVRGAHNITVASRTWANSNELAKKVGATAAYLQDALSEISIFDIVICASRSPSYLITLESARDAICARASNPMFLIDLSVPKNIDPQARMGEIGLAKTEITRRSSMVAERLFTKASL